MVRTGEGAIGKGIMNVATAPEGKSLHGRRMNMNLGIYGVPPVLAAAVEAGDDDFLFPMVSKVRELEAWLREVKGFQHTYCDSFQSEAEFEEMFDHSLYVCVGGRGMEGGRQCTHPASCRSISFLASSNREGIFNEVI
jgi:hypothetical protein